MKKLLIAASLLLASNTFAVEKTYGMAGCGLGAVVFGDAPGMVQLAATFLNNIYGNQTSGMTSGTSNCVEGGVALKDAEQEYFTQTNMTTLQQEMAQGQGETLGAYASLFGCESQSFSSAMQQNYDQLNAENPEALVNDVRQMVIQGRAGTCQSL